jgi:Na+-transporting NADH:ubiquinone oxidoreductase subunit C
MGLRGKTWFPILYMFIVTLTLSAILILFGNITRQRVTNNERIAYERAVLRALPVDLPSGAGPAQIHNIFLANITDPDEKSAGAHRYMVEDSLLAYALPFEGAGFWAPIKGVIGISRDRKTITGIAFYEQNETPGLGGEIVKTEFTRQFVGKKLAMTPPYIEFLPATATLDESSVHAITGATQTSNRLGKFMNTILGTWREHMDDPQ